MGRTPPSAHRGGQPDALHSGKDRHKQGRSLADRHARRAATSRDRTHPAAAQSLWLPPRSARRDSVTRWPSVGVVVPTINRRPAELKAALAAIAAQDYPGEISVVVVFDGAQLDDSLAAGERVRVVANDRRAGLAGARNCGIL